VKETANEGSVLKYGNSQVSLVRRVWVYRSIGLVCRSSLFVGYPKIDLGYLYFDLGTADCTKPIPYLGP
jgi:hypothetical protein